MNKESSHLKTVMSYNKIGLKGNHTILNTKTKGTMIGAKSNQRDKGEAKAKQGSMAKAMKSQEKAKEKPRGEMRRLGAKSSVNLNLNLM